MSSRLATRRTMKLEDLRRYRRVLTNDELMTRAPSIFATEPFHTMTERYRYIPTITVVDLFRSQGLLPTAAYQSRCRIEEVDADMIGFKQELVDLREQFAADLADLRERVADGKSRKAAARVKLAELKTTK
jgi:hypothetical protein